MKLKERERISRLGQATLNTNSRSLVVGIDLISNKDLQDWFLFYLMLHIEHLEPNMIKR